MRGKWFSPKLFTKAMMKGVRREDIVSEFLKIVPFTQNALKMC